MPGCASSSRRPVPAGAPGGVPAGARRLALIVALASLGLAGCQADAGPSTEPRPPSLEPVVLGHASLRRAPEDSQERRRPDPAAAGWPEKLALAQGYAAGGYDAEALAVLDAALALSPPEPWAGRLRDLKASLRLRRAQETLLRIVSRGARDYYPFGRDVEVEVRLANVSGAELVFAAPPPGASPSALTLEVRCVDRDVYASRLRRAWSRTFALTAEGRPPLVIPPGGEHAVRVRIPAADLGPPLAGLRALEVSGVLRPTGLTRGGEPRSVRVPVRAGRVVVLPEGYEPLARDPLGALEQSAATGAALHLLLAAEFLAPGERPEAAARLAAVLARGPPGLRRAAVGALGLLRERAVGEPLAPFVGPLVAALAEHPDAAEALMEGLAEVTGRHLAPDPRLWADWWRREEGRRPLVAPYAED